MVEYILCTRYSFNFFQRFQIVSNFIFYQRHEHPSIKDGEKNTTGSKAEKPVISTAQFPWGIGWGNFF